MNNPGLPNVIQDSEVEVPVHHQSSEPKQVHITDNLNKLQSVEENEKKFPRPEKHINRQKTWQQRHKQSRRKYDEDDEEEASIYQSTLWWFSSTVFPLFAGTFGPVANLFSVCALAQTWRVEIDDGSRVPDPRWLVVLNACSLFCALVANLALLFNFARRIPYSIAQPITILFWYFACIFLLIPISLIRDSRLDPLSITIAYSQSYYYALISCILYFSVSTLLLISTLGSMIFHAYRPSFSTLTNPQRTLMLQTIVFLLYLSLGAGVFSTLEGWEFSDGIYWADYTLLTIGIGTDFPLMTTLGRMLLIPYAAVGITLIGLVVSSVRDLVLERAKVKVVRRHLGKEREKWKQNIKERRRLAALKEMAAPTQDSQTSPTWREKRKEKELMRLPHRFEKRTQTPLKKEDHLGPWHRAEFELMRFIEDNTETVERYTALVASFFLVLLLWIGGSLIFWSCEHKSQRWTYPDSIYFTYTTLLTIGYGDLYPSSAAGKPFFVVWSLISVPAMTVLISNMGDTVVKWMQNFTAWASSWTILPERKPGEEQKGGKKKRKQQRQSKTTKKDIGEVGKQKPPILPQLPDPSTTETQKGLGSQGLSFGDERTKVPSAKVDFDEREGEHSDNDHSSVFRHDIEALSSEVEHFEGQEGRGGSLPTRLAEEISVLAKDMSAKPPKKYTWDEWVRWLNMLGEREYGAGWDTRSQSWERLRSQSGAEEAEAPQPPPMLAETPPAGKSLTVEVPSGFEDSEKHPPDPHSGDLDTADAHHDFAPVTAEDWRWTWLGDHGPLFSNLTETEWIIEKLCFRMVEVLEDEIKEARAQASLIQNANMRNGQG